MNYFQKLSINDSFPLCYNLLPHFAAAEQDYNVLNQCVKEVLDDGRIQAFFLSDRPAQKQEFSSLHLAEDILASGGEPVVSLSLSFYDRNSITKRLLHYCQLGVQHFILVSGDYPLRNKAESQKPVFDIDSVQLLMLLTELPKNLKFIKGCVVNPFKYFESEQIWQYEKLQRKINLGADFIVTQLGYDLRKFDEVKNFCTLHNISAPLIANVFTADLQTASLIQTRIMPGVKIPAPLLRILSEKTNDRKEILERTAKTLNVLKGFGYNGALLGCSQVDFSEIRQILDLTEAMHHDWQEFIAELDYSDSTSNKFYYFQKNPYNDLNTSEPAPVALKHFPSPTYSFSYFIDWLIYVPQGPLFKLTGRFCSFSSTRKFWYGFLWLLEYISKHPLYGCIMCGDCTLYACGFLCYQAGCPKKLLNGPCGGSIDGYCEVFPGKKRCFWVKVYHNMKGVRQQVTYTAPPIPARNISLKRTSSWINFFTGKDHRKMNFEKKLK
jgi:methylenetetrahydrofolate reductase (NADPH)